MCNEDGPWGQSEANQIMQVPTESHSRRPRRPRRRHRRHGGFYRVVIPGSGAPHFSILAVANAPLVSPARRVYEQIARPRFINSIDGGVSNRRPSD